MDVAECCLGARRGEEDRFGGDAPIGAQVECERCGAWWGMLRFRGKWGKRWERLQQGCVGFSDRGRPVAEREGLLVHVRELLKAEGLKAHERDFLVKMEVGLSWGDVLTEKQEKWVRGLMGRYLRVRV